MPLQLLPFNTQAGPKAKLRLSLEERSKRLLLTINLYRRQKSNPAGIEYQFQILVGECEPRQIAGGHGIQPGDKQLIEGIAEILTGSGQRLAGSTGTDRDPCEQGCREAKPDRQS